MTITLFLISQSRRSGGRTFWPHTIRALLPSLCHSAFLSFWSWLWLFSCSDDDCHHLLGNIILLTYGEKKKLSFIMEFSKPSSSVWLIYISCPRTVTISRRMQSTFGLTLTFWNKQTNKQKQPLSKVNMIVLEYSEHRLIFF